MPESKLIGRPAPDSTPTALSNSRGRRRDLPPDLLRQASRRLEIMALVGTALWLLEPILGHIAFHSRNPEDPKWVHIIPTDLVALGAAVVSLALVVYLRKVKHDPGFVVDLKRVVLACLAKKPDQRPRSAGELDRMLGEIEIAPWSEEEATRWWRTHQPV